MKKSAKIKLTIYRAVGNAIASVFSDAHRLRRYHVDWNYYDISKMEDNKIKILQISDLHFDGLRPFHKILAANINESSPDLLCFTGDTVNETKHLTALQTFLELVDYSIKKYAVLGNWEYAGEVDLTMLKAVYSKNNCELLINEHRTVTLKDRRISTIGIDDLIGGKPDFEKSTQNIKRSETTILLSHCPGYRDVVAKEKTDLQIDLILSGHTHGGQITFRGRAPLKPNGSGKYLRGWYRETEPKMYISKGVGTTLLPFRLGATAEIVEMDV